MWFSADPKLLYDQDANLVLLYLKGTATQGIILKLDLEKGIESYVDVNFIVGWNQEEGKEPGSFLSRTGYIIIYANCPIIWASRIHPEIALSTTEAEYIYLLQAMRYALPFFSLMKEI